MTTLPKQRATDSRDEVIPKNFLDGVNARTRGEVEDAFNKVADQENWKNPIGREVALTSDERERVRWAIIFYTGSRPTFDALPAATPREDGRTLYRVTAAGYYKTIGA